MDEKEKARVKLMMRLAGKIMDQFEITEEVEVEGYHFFHVKFKPETELGDGTFLMTFQVRSDGQLELIDYVAEVV